LSYLVDILAREQIANTEQKIRPWADFAVHKPVKAHEGNTEIALFLCVRNPQDVAWANQFPVNIRLGLLCA